MNDDAPERLHKSTFYLSLEHACSYLPEETSQTLFLDPDYAIEAADYQALIEQGFRRSGSHIYRPWCPICKACTSLRVPVANFRPRRSQRRCWKNNLPVFEVSVKAAAFDVDHYRLYQGYTSSRHPGGGMTEASPERYMEFLTAPWLETWFIEFRFQQKLAAVAVTDKLLRGLSAVYTFYEPDMAAVSPGVFSVLWQIELTKKLGLEHLYLGYWIQNCQKMSYKDQYRPVEAWTGSKWMRFHADDSLSF